MQKPKAQIFGLYSSASLHVSKTLVCLKVTAIWAVWLIAPLLILLSVVKLCNWEERTTEEHKFPQNKPKEADHKKGKMSHWLYSPTVNTHTKIGGGHIPNIFWLFPISSQIGMLKAFHSPKNCLSSLRKIFQAALDPYEEVLSVKSILWHTAPCWVDVILALFCSWWDA